MIQVSQDVAVSHHPQLLTVADAASKPDARRVWKVDPDSSDRIRG